MIAVGCDFGLRKSGIVLLNENYEILSQNLLRVNQDIKGAERLVKIEKGFDNILKPYLKEDLEIFIEGYAYGAKYQRESLAELGGVIRRYLYLSKLNFWVIPPTSLKSFVTGTGKASKNYMKKCTKEKWGETFKSDDVCDAYGIARLGTNVMKTLRGKQDVTSLEEAQQTVIQDVLMNQEFYKNSNTAKKRKRNVRTKRKTKS